MEKELRELFCKWCLHDCKDREIDPLTDEERAGCVASGGFAEEAINLPLAGMTVGCVAELVRAGRLGAYYYDNSVNPVVYRPLVTP